jgi:hypothetical protein
MGLMPLEEKSVVQTGLHQYGHVAALRHCAQRAANVETTQARHDYVEHHAIRRLLAELAKGRHAIRRGDDAKARHFQCGADQQARARIVIDDQNRRRSAHLIFGYVHHFLLA